MMTAACDRMALLCESALEGTLSDEEGRFVAEHGESCPSCRDALAAVRGDGQLWSALDMGQDEGVAGAPAEQAVVDHLAGKPVYALDLQPWKRFGVMAAGFVATLMLIWVTGMRADRAAQGWMLIDLPAMGWMILFGVAAITFGHRRVESRPGWRVAILGVVLVTFVVTTALLRPVIPFAGNFMGHAAACISLGTGMSLVSIIPAVFWARRGMAGPKVSGALFLGAMAAAMGVANLQLHCRNAELGHLIVGHGLVFVLAPALALAMRRLKIR
jgi:hypothetical protein